MTNLPGVARRHAALIGVSFLLAALPWPHGGRTVVAQSNCRITPIGLPARVSESLSDTDCEAPHRPGRKADLYTFEAGLEQQITIDMTGEPAFDTYLILVGPDGSVVAEDDDSGPGLDSRIQFTTRAAGTYTIEATAFSSAFGRGPYTLVITSPLANACTPPAVAAAGAFKGALPATMYPIEVTSARASAARLQPAAAAATAGARGITRVNVAADGSQANGFSTHPALSSDGRFVVFESDATNLVAGDTNGQRDIFVYDRSTGVTTRDSLGPGGAQANAASEFPQISTDGRYVTFLSQATNLVPGVSGRQLYLRDRLLGITTIVSISSGGIPANSTVEDTYALSPNGRVLAFSSAASNLVTGDTNAIADIFVRDVSSGSTTRDSVASNGAQASGASNQPAISEDGRYVSFCSSAANLAPGLTGSVARLFVHDRSSGETALESIGPAGEILAALSTSMNGDGRFVVFTAQSGGSGSAYHVYLRDRQTRQTAIALPNSTSGVWAKLSADGQFVSYDRTYGSTSYAEAINRASSQAVTISPGRFTTPVRANLVAFESSLALVSGDTNGTSDIFIAPAGGQPGAPDPPFNLTFSTVGSSLVLTWTAAAGGTPATEYILEAGSLTHSTDVANVSSGSTDTRFSANVTGRPTYYIRVRAANAAGASLPSNEVVTTSSALPGAPSALKATVAGSTLTLEWSPAAGAIASYIIEAGSAPGLTDLANFNTGTNSTTFTASSVSAGTYYVRVRAASSGGLGPPSNEVTVVVTGSCLPPSPPTALTRSVTGSSVTLTWAAGIGATSYVLEAGTSAGSTNVVVTDLNSTATTLTSNGVPPGAYFIRLRSKNACGQSAVSNEVTAIVQ